jgi:DNA-binding response OmpR family regulator
VIVWRDVEGSPMPNLFLEHLGAKPSQPPLPLQGLMVLVVEDSRYAAEALRLMCQRSGARLKRAEDLRTAQAHLHVYRPDVVIIDLGLPDGRGEALIRDLANRWPRIATILGTSGAEDGAEVSLAAGADGFLDKPLTSLRAFQEAILQHRPPGPDHDTGPALHPDPLALRDDLQKAASLAGDEAQRMYLSSFVTSLARSVGDVGLANAARDILRGGKMDALSGVLADRLRRTSHAFGKG